MEYGHVKISRKAYETDQFWNEPRVFSRWEAWEDLIQMAAWRSHERLVGSTIVTVNRGEVLASLRYLAERWRWSKNKVVTFLALLVQMDRIAGQRETQVGTVYLLVNYARYQSRSSARGTANGTPEGQGFSASSEEGPENRDSDGDRETLAIRADTPLVGTPNGTAEGQQRDSRGTNRRQLKKSKQTTTDGSSPVDLHFERAWSLYPKRSGGNPKQRAHRAWNARREDGVDAATLIAAVERYAAYIDATDKANTPYVMQTASFFGPERRGWEEDWRVPKEPNGRSAPSVFYKTPEELRAERYAQ